MPKSMGVFKFLYFCIGSSREAWRINLATEQLDMRNYARCEWKCMEWIGTDDWGKICHAAIRKDAIHRVSTTDQNPFQFILYIAADSGETTSNGDDMFRPKKKLW